jgi:hypothetical protein
MTEFWRSSGFHLVSRDGNGKLRVTDDFLRAYLLRPELRPVEESCAAERALHQALLDDPRDAVAPGRLAELADPDARENYEVMLQFRDLLVAAGTLEDCYLSLFAGDQVAAPPLFVDQLAHVIVRNLLDGNDDPFCVRAGELLFRAQKVMIRDGAVLLADAETYDMYATTGGYGSLGRLVVAAQTPLAEVELDVVTEENAAAYWRRDERFDMVLNATFGQPGLDALCRVLEAWVRHFLGIGTRIQPVQRISDERWVWHVGLDAEGTAILNDLYESRDVDEERLARILALFRLEFEDPGVMVQSIAGRPVYLAMAMTADNRLRLKPQNLLVNLPLATA